MLRLSFSSHMLKLRLSSIVSCMLRLEISFRGSSLPPLALKLSLSLLMPEPMLSLSGHADAGYICRSCIGTNNSNSWAKLTSPNFNMRTLGVLKGSVLILSRVASSYEPCELPVAQVYTKHTTKTKTCHAEHDWLNFCLVFT